MTLELTEMRLQSARDRINKYIDRNILQWGEEEVLQPAQQIAFNEGLSDKAIGSMEIRKVGFMHIQFHWDYRGPNNEPLHTFINDGVLPHIIRSKGKEFGGADALRWFEAGGTPIFRKEVHHPGYAGKHIKERVQEIGREKLRQRIVKETENYMAVNKI